MRLVFVHADAVSFEATGGSAAADGLIQRSASIASACLVVFFTQEAGDERDPESVVASAVEAITATATHLSVGQALLVPMAHLSPVPAPAPDTLEALGTSLDTELDTVVCAPADDKTSLQLSAKGHPHARQSTRVWPHTSGDAGTGGHEWTVAFPDGSTGPAEGGRTVDQPMRTLLAQSSPDGSQSTEWTAPNPADTGLSPASKQFLRDSITEFVRTEAVDAGAVPVETAGTTSRQNHGHVRRAPGLPRKGSPALATVLRARTDSEHTSRCYRLATARGPHGDTGSETLPHRTVPELWALTGGETPALAEFGRQVELVDWLADSLGHRSTALLRVSQQGWEQRRDWIDGLVTRLDEPVLVARGAAPGDPWEIGLTRLSVIDGQPIRLGSVGVAFRGLTGLDSNDAEQPDRDTTESGPLVCAALLCSVERAVMVTVDRARERDPRRLPAWLAPEQVRLVPTDPAAYTDSCESIADEIEAGDPGLRVGIDASERSVGERLERAASALVPYVAVVGRPEADGEPLSVTDRAARTELDLPPAALRERLQDEVDGWPQKPRYQPRRLDTSPGRGSQSTSPDS